jgi:hypothetical protein
MTDDSAIEWLLTSPEPAVRNLVRRDVLGERADEPILDGPWVRALFAGQRDDGGFGGHPYKKWVGAHWRLVSLVELGVPAGDPRAVAAAERVLTWLTGDSHRKAVKSINGLVRRCASQEGNALAVCSRLGMGDDPRVRLLAESLVEWQWPDGGWNCDLRASGHRSSFHETLPPLWGLHEYAVATGDKDAGAAAERAAELLLEHRVFRSLRTGEPIHPSVVVLHYPPYWHYDVLQALLVLGRVGMATDPRTADAADMLRRRQLPDGRWRAGGRWWRPPNSPRGMVDAVDWGETGSNQMITLNALRGLAAAGR